VNITLNKAVATRVCDFATIPKENEAFFQEQQDVGKYFSGVKVLPHAPEDFDAVTVTESGATSCRAALRFSYLFKG
jgi:hypothetical protein